MKHPLQRCARRMNRDVQHEQRRGDGEHAVAECFHPALAERSASTRRVFVSWHGIASFASAVGGNTFGDMPSGRQPGGTMGGTVKPSALNACEAGSCDPRQRVLLFGYETGDQADDHAARLDT